MITIKVADAERGIAWLTEGFDFFKRNIGVWIGVSVIFLIFYIILSAIPVIGGLLLALLTPVFLGGLMLGCRDLDQGKALALNHLFAGFSGNTGQLILLGLLNYVGMILIMVISMIIVMPFLGGMEFMTQFMHTMEHGDIAMAPDMFIGVLLVMLVGMLFYLPLIMALWFAPVLIVVDRQNAIDALVNSFKGCLKNILPFLLYGLLGLVLAIVASIPLMLGWLVLFPMIVASIYLGYKDIFKEEEESAIAG
jgi:uncharacterized membrane protein